MTVIGIAIGLTAAMAGSRFIQSLLYDVSPRDPMVIAVTTPLLAAVALPSCWVPARRAARLSPLEGMRAD